MNTENNRKTRKEHLVLINQKFNEVDCLIIDYLNEVRRMEANMIKTNALDKTVEQPTKETVPKRLKLSEIFKAMPYTTNKVGKTFVQSVPTQKEKNKIY